MEKDNFQALDIQWIKSVKRDNGNQWAYMEYNVGDTFTLNFSKNPKWYPTNYLKAKPGDLLMLFQKLNQTNIYPSGWYITHLVTPVDNTISKEENNPNHPYIRLVAVIGKNDNLIPLDKTNWSLFLCNRGQICSINKFENKNLPEISKIEKQNFIWSFFDQIDTSLIQNIGLENIPEIDELEVEEGAEKSIMKLHKYKERDRTVIKAAKEKAKRENKLFCEVCTFNFKDTYSNIGEGFIECHHRLPIASGGIRKTKVGDLALVCANCHRMLHRKNELNTYLTIKELKDIIVESKR